MTYSTPPLSTKQQVDSLIPSRPPYQLHRDYPLNDFVTSMDLSPMNKPLIRVSGIGENTQYIVASALGQVRSPVWIFYSIRIWGRDAIADAETLKTAGPQFKGWQLLQKI